MNYFAHGRAFVHEPYFLAGTAVPDWLNVVDRKVRVRSVKAAAFVNDADTLTASLARGIVQHHADDGWFHNTRAFVELSAEFTQRIVKNYPSDTGPRAGFLGHILVEILLDAHLIETDSARLEAYYAALAELDSPAVAAAVSRMAGQPADGLALLIPRFSAARFLYDYGTDAKLLPRLNAVLQRVGLQELPTEFANTLAQLRPQVAQRAHELLAKND